MFLGKEKVEENLLTINQENKIFTHDASMEEYFSHFIYVLPTLNQTQYPL